MIDWLRRRVMVPAYDRHSGNDRLRYLPTVTRALSASRAFILHWQFDRFEELVRTAYAEVPFYRRLYDARGFHPRQLRRAEDISLVPTVTKDDLRTENADFINPRFNPKTLIRTGTGGTTASPVPIYYTRECWSEKEACTLFFYRWFGCDVQDRRAFLWGAVQDINAKPSARERIRQYLTTPSLMLPSSYLNDAVLADYYERLTRFRPRSLQAYPTPLFLFCQFLKRRSLRLRLPNVNTTAEPLHEHQRELIEHVLGTKVFNWYGARELGHIATECELHRGMHINSHGVYLEVLPCEASAGDDGEIVATDLLNNAMPLIRYRIGDTGRISTRECKCGSALPILEALSGREVDVLRRADGTMVPGVSLTNRVIASCAAIEQLQIVQTSYEDFVFNIVKGPSFSDAAVVELKRNVERFMDTPIRADVRFVTQLTPEPSGKVRLCKCDMFSFRADQHAASAPRRSDLPPQKLR